MIGFMIAASLIIGLVLVHMLGTNFVGALFVSIALWGMFALIVKAQRKSGE